MAVRGCATSALGLVHAADLVVDIGKFDPPLVQVRLILRDEAGMVRERHEATEDSAPPHHS